MQAAERVRTWLERADFTGAGCRHSQALIASGCACSRRTVIRAIAQLEAEGAITVKRAPRNSRICNVYRVAGRNPQIRRGMLAFLKAHRAAVYGPNVTQKELQRRNGSPRPPGNPPPRCFSGRTSAAVAHAHARGRPERRCSAGPADRFAP